GADGSQPDVRSGSIRASFPKPLDEMRFMQRFGVWAGQFPGTLEVGRLDAIDLGEDGASLRKSSVLAQGSEHDREHHIGATSPQGLLGSAVCYSTSVRDAEILGTVS